jgi:tetratricopeptide (TPR) repeat protein
LFTESKLEDAEVMFRDLAESGAGGPAVTEPARYYLAECLFHRGLFPRAADAYIRFVESFPTSRYRKRALQRLYDIADYWLNDLRDEMQEDRKLLVSGGGWWWRATGLALICCKNAIHCDKSKPIFNQARRAADILERIARDNPRSPLAARAAFLAATAHLYRSNYSAADRCYSRALELRPKGPLAVRSLELALFAKMHKTDAAIDRLHQWCVDTLWDLGLVSKGYTPRPRLRTLLEARLLINKARRDCPELSSGEREFFLQQVKAVNEALAEYHFELAEVCRSSGCLGLAYLYYEFVRRNYSETVVAEKARQKQEAYWVSRALRSLQRPELR